MYRDVVVCVTLICAFVGSGHTKGIPYTKCGVNEYQCDDGQCIDSAFRCDGTIHCKDASDESVLRCEKFPASNCTSSDDKDSSRCSSSRPTVRTARRIPPLVARFRRQSSRTVTPTCLVPPQPKYGRWKLERSFCDSEDDCHIPQGLSLGLHYELVYSCNGGSQMRGRPSVICEETGNWTAIPVCIDTLEIKCSRLNTESTNVACYHEGKQIDCSVPVPPGTRAELSCRTGYKEDLSSTVTRRDKIVCDSDGFWSPNPISCVPFCGVVQNRQISSESNATAGKLTDLPWHATLYKEKKINDVSKKEFVCGATIIHTRIVLTAAHCVYDERTRSTPSPSTFYVSAGDVIKDYDSPLHNHEIVQRSRVRNIHTHCPYHGSRDDYVADIALLELDEPFMCTGILLPACLDVSGHENQIVGPGSLGKVPGFGKSSTDSIDAIMETITVPYANDDECRVSRRKHDDHYLITDDKFCTGTANGKKTCHGDRGAGLVFKKGIHWYVMGVASVPFKSQDNDRNCSNQPYGLYTKVSSYIRWIQNVMYALEFNEHVTPCDLDCFSLDSETTVTTCFSKDQWKSCDSYVPPNTKAKISCRSGYIKSSSGTERVVCKTNGKWDPEPITCLPSNASSVSAAVSTAVNKNEAYESSTSSSSVPSSSIRLTEASVSISTAPPIVETTVASTATSISPSAQTDASVATSVSSMDTQELPTTSKPDSPSHDDVHSISVPVHSKPDEILNPLHTPESDPSSVANGFSRTDNNYSMVSPHKKNKPADKQQVAKLDLPQLPPPIAANEASQMDADLDSPAKDVYSVVPPPKIYKPLDSSQLAKVDLPQLPPPIAANKTSQVAADLDSPAEDVYSVVTPPKIYKPLDSSQLAKLDLPQLPPPIAANEASQMDADLDSPAEDVYSVVTPPKIYKPLDSSQLAKLDLPQLPPPIAANEASQMDADLDSPAEDVYSVVTPPKIYKPLDSSQLAKLDLPQLPPPIAANEASQMDADLDSPAEDVYSVVTPPKIYKPLDSSQLAKVDLPQLPPPIATNKTSQVAADLDSPAEDVYSVVTPPKIYKPLDSSQLAKVDLPQLPPPIATNKTSQVAADLDSPAEDVYSVVTPPKIYKPLDSSQLAKLDLPQLPPPIAANEASQMDADLDSPAKDVYSVVPPPKIYKPLDSSQLAKLDLPQLPPPIAANEASQTDADLDSPAKDVYSVVPPPKAFKPVDSSQYIGAPNDGRGKIAEEMCVKWASQIKNNASLSNESKDSENNFECPKNENYGSILVGKSIKVKEFAFLAIIGSSSGSTGTQWLCSGSLISPNFVLSIASCALNKQRVADRIRLGAVHFTRTNRAARPQDRSIVRTIIHPKFKLPSEYDNLVLFKVKDPFELNAWVYPVCLHRAPTIEYSSVTVTGYGRLRYEDRTGLPDARQITLNFYHPNACNASYQNNKRFPGGIDEERVFCTNGSHPDACQISAVGSSVVIPSGKHTCMWELVGLYAYSNHCGGPNPIVSLRTYHYINWIESVVWPQAKPHVF